MMSPGLLQLAYSFKGALGAVGAVVAGTHYFSAKALGVVFYAAVVCGNHHPVG